jgi:hypothetical protein
VTADKFLVIQSSSLRIKKTRPSSKEENLENLSKKKKNKFPNSPNLGISERNENLGKERGAWRSPFGNG